MSEQCENCGRTIGRLETPRVWNERVVCSACEAHLRQPTPVRSSDLPSPVVYVQPTVRRSSQYLRAATWVLSGVVKFALICLFIVLASAFYIAHSKPAKPVPTAPAVDVDAVHGQPSTSQADQPVQQEAPKTPPVLVMGQELDVGTVRINVLSLSRSLTIGAKPYAERSDGVFVNLRVSITNRGNEQAHLQDYLLVDVEGRTYGTSSKGFLIPDVLHVYDELNPGVAKVGMLVYDVPATTSNLFLLLGERSQPQGYIQLLAPSQMSSK